MKEYFERLYKNRAEEYYKTVEEYLDRGSKKFIVTANPETFQLARTDNNLEQIILNSDNDIIPDGIAIVKAAKHYGIFVEERITGFDTALRLLELADKKKKSVYFFGSKREVIDALIEVVKRNYPGIIIAGYSDGYVENKDKVFKEIISLKPDICMVALGIPLQEFLIAKYIERFSKGIFIGVGGSFDVLSGSKIRAPQFFINHNLEWLYRICREPKRLKRFYKNNVKFIIDVYRDKNR